MSRLTYILITLFVIFLSSKIESSAQSWIDSPCEIQKIADDHINITINKSDNEGITVLQVTDLHLGDKGKWRDDINTFRRINRLVEMYNPDLLALTGDVFAGKDMAAIVIRHFDELERPWLYVFGNHDAEGESKEKVWYEEDDGSTYEAFVEMGNIEASL
ncbi:MAG: metallophosphoesterase [Bacteroidota bacterium]